MKSILSLMCLIVLINCDLIGQNKKYKNIRESEIELLNDLSSTIDTSITFVISPLIFSSVDSSLLDITLLKKKYGFKKSQFSENLLDTFFIKSNKNFKIINPDSLIKYKAIKITLFEDPLISFIEKAYKKEGICYFRETIFSKSGNYAIAKYWIHCGLLCGYGETILMKRIRNKWVKIDTLVVSQS
jgi:hypothetical protein